MNTLVFALSKRLARRAIRATIRAGIKAKGKPRVGEVGREFLDLTVDELELLVKDSDHNGLLPDIRFRTGQITRLFELAD